MHYTSTRTETSTTGRDDRAQGGSLSTTAAARGLLEIGPDGRPLVEAVRTGNGWEIAEGRGQADAGNPLAAAIASVCGRQDGAPPHTNRGVLPTGSVDWLGFSVPDGTKPEDVMAQLGADGWVEMPQGWYGYRRGYVRGNVRVLYDGQEGMGVHVEASGQGCRDLECAGVVKDWQEFLVGLLEQGANLSRLDVAFDDAAETEGQGRVKLGQVVKAVQEQTVISRYRSWKVEQSGSLGAPEDQGTTVYFGSAQSATRIRMYDKARQLGQAGHWVRVELQARDDKAQQLAQVIAYRGVGSVAGVLRGLLDFKDASTDSNRWRWSTSAWWSEFLGAMEKVRLTIQKAARSLAEVYSWVERQVGPSLAVLVEAQNGSLKFLARLVRENRYRLKAHHRQLLGAPMEAAAG